MTAQPAFKFWPRTSVVLNRIFSSGLVPNGFVLIAIGLISIVPISIVLLSLILLPSPSKASSEPQVPGPEILGSEIPGSKIPGSDAPELEALGPKALGPQTREPQALKSQSQVLTLAQDKRIEAAICPDSMNRIAVANDRITQIFGDDGAFESQNDENTGQVFLKPTTENGTKALSLTLITEQGITQDLTLKPTARSATTLIFKNTAPVSRTGQDTGQHVHQGRERLSSIPLGSNPFDARTQPSFLPEQTYPPQHHLLTLLKNLLTGQTPFEESASLYTQDPRPAPEGLEISPHRSYTADPYDIHIFQVENTMGTAMEMQEKSFYQSGDLAISLQRRILPPGAKTLLYVVRVSTTQVSMTRVSMTRAPGTHMLEHVSEGGGHD